jgi:hypothetical protein
MTLLKKKRNPQSRSACEETVKMLIVSYLASTFMKIPAPGKGNGSAIATIHNFRAWL